MRAACYTGLTNMKYSDFRKTENGCPFCATPDKEKFLQNDSAFLTFALAPYHQDHLLVVTKRHFDKVLDATSKEMSDIDDMEGKAVKILHNLGYKNITILVREGEGTGKTVEHIHYHIIPDTRIGDLDHDNNNRAILTPEEIAGLSARVREVVKSI